MCQQYWTLETCGEKFGPFIVETTAEIKSDPSMTVRDFTITNTLNVSLKHAVDCDIKNNNTVTVLWSMHKPV